MNNVRKIEEVSSPVEQQPEAKRANTVSEEMTNQVAQSNLQAGGLPNELWQRIMLFCEPREICQLRQTCQQLLRLTTNHSFLNKRFPVFQKLEDREYIAIDHAATLAPLALVIQTATRIQVLDFELSHMSGKVFSTLAPLIIRMESLRLLHFHHLSCDEKMVTSFDEIKKKKPILKFHILDIEFNDESEGAYLKFLEKSAWQTLNKKGCVRPYLEVRGSRYYRALEF